MSKNYIGRETKKYITFHTINILFSRYKNMDQIDYRRNMRKRDEVNGKQVGCGCLTIILIGIVAVLFSSENFLGVAIGLAIIVALFLLGAIITGAFKD